MLRNKNIENYLNLDITYITGRLFSQLKDKKIKAPFPQYKIRFNLPEFNLHTTFKWILALSSEGQTGVSLP